MTIAVAIIALWLALGFFVNAARRMRDLSIMTQGLPAQARAHYAVASVGLPALFGAGLAGLGLYFLFF